MNIAKTRTKLGLFEKEGVKGLLSDLLLLIQEEGLITEEIQDEKENFIIMLKAKYMREIEEHEEKYSKQKKLDL